LNQSGQLPVRWTESDQIEPQGPPLRPGASDVAQPGNAPPLRPGRELPSDRGLAWLGSWLASGRAGYHQVQVLDEASVDAVDAHVGRVARRLGRRLLRADSRWVDCGIRHILQHLGETPSVWDAGLVVDQLLRVTQGAIVCWVGGGALSAFDRRCLDLLRTEPGGAQMIEVSVRSNATVQLNDDDVVLVGQDPSSLAQWWAEVIEDEAGHGVPLTVGRAEAVWRGARTRWCVLPAEGSARVLLSALHQSRTAWPDDAFEGVGSARDWESLQRDGFVARCDGLLELSRQVDGSQLPAVDASVAREMMRVMPNDPWVAARASTLLLEAGDDVEGQRAFGEVVKSPRYDALRTDLWRLWADAVKTQPAEKLPALALASAEMALELEEGPAADVFSEILRGSGGVGTFELSWVLGRTQLLRADGRAARVSLEQAAQHAPEPSLHWLARAHQAEASLLDGNMAAAESVAREVVEGDSAHARLIARNVLGKLILAKGSPDAAESHFAEDELEALQLGLVRMWMRSRVNRSVALLARADAEGALALLEEVLRTAEKNGDVRACAMAHLNMGVAQHTLRDYHLALEHYEKTIELSRRSGDQIALCSAARNLAELRVTLGLVNEAWQALQFAQRSSLRKVAPARLVERALVGARILLARGDTVAASVKVTEALALSDRASLKRTAAECHRLAARIALREGDVDRAFASLEALESDDADDFALAETSLLRGKLARARGLDAEQDALDAMVFAVRANEEDLLLEVNLLLSEMALARGSVSDAKRYARGAAEVRERLASRVRGAVRHAFLSREDCRTVDVLLNACDGVPPESHAPPSSPRRGAATATRPFVGTHPSILGLLAKVRRVAKSDAPVLIRGESGTGKELIAEIVHRASERSDGPFVVVNCAALVETLLLSELFGHERGAFTGAVQRNRGRFELADRGTLFLDEIGDIAPRAQVALLRVLQTGTFSRVGGTTTLSTDVRVVCATHRDLDALVAAGEFRQDLYFRLCGVPIDVPPLRDRGTDVLVLAQHVLDELQAEGGAARRFSTTAKRLLSRHAWPGNVRELQNVVRAAAILSDGSTIEEKDLAEHLQRSPQQHAERGFAVDSVHTEVDVVRSAYESMRHLDLPLPELKRRIEEGCIALAMVDARGQITRAAGYLGMKRPRVSQLVKSYGLKMDNDKEA
jgi:DNA-binding NtrC family response regulator/tetratricopeptide (TPR) repeat protein